MGLDIFCHRVKANQLVSSNINEVYERVNADAQKKFKNKCNKLLIELGKAYNESEINCSPSIYYKAFNNFKDKLKKDIRYKTYDFTFPFKENRVYSYNESVDLVMNEIKYYYKMHDAYFRKVNFIYAFFQDFLVDESCLVSKSAIVELMDYCKDVLEHHKADKDGGVAYAEANLPTQAGFFFGSTEYDEWYFNDVKDCWIQMGKLLHSLKEGDMVLWNFSW